MNLPGYSAQYAHEYHQIRRFHPGYSAQTGEIDKRIFYKKALYTYINVNSGLDLNRFDKYTGFGVIEMIRHQTRYGMHDSVQGRTLTAVIDVLYTRWRGLGWKD